MQIDIREYLPERYRDFVQEDGEINWDALEMVYPGHKEKIMLAISTSLKLTGAILERNLLPPSSPLGPQGRTGPNRVLGEINWYCSE